MKSYLNYIILLVIVISFYGNTLTNGFVHDDVWQVQKRSISQVFTSCIAEEIVGGCERGFYWRPMQYLSYYFTIFASSEPWVFHLVNLIYLWIAGVLVLWLMKMLFESSKLWFLPLVSAVIFIAHPVNSEVVNWVSATPELLSTIFGLLTLLFYLKKLYLFSVSFFFLALLSKETSAIVVPLMLFFLSVISIKSKGILKNVKPLFFYLIPLGLYLVLRSVVLGRVVYKYEGYWELTFLDQLYTNLALLPHYLLKLVWPLPLSFQPFVEPTRAFIWEVALGFGVLLMILILLGVMWFKRQYLLVFGFILIFAGILPALVFINKIGQFLFSERYLFFSTVGFGVVAAEIIVRTVVRTSPRLAPGRRVQPLLVLLGVFLIFGSWFVVVQRARDWKDNELSYRAMIRVDERNWNAHLGLGRLYAANSDLDLAKQEYKRVLELDLQNIEAKNELGFLENKYDFNDIYSFNYPLGWSVSRQDDQMIVNDEDVNVEITTDTKKPSLTYQQYLKEQELQANLVNQGLAQIPGVDLAWVRIYGSKFEFFLFNGERVVRIVAGGIESKQAQNDFNRILGSIKIKK